MPIDAALIEERGWRQGSLFTLAASQPLILAHRERVSVPNFDIPENARLIIASHDCDIVHRDVHEPRIEVCPAVALPGAISGNFSGTRNPRRLHIELEINGSACAYELRAPTRFVLPREVLQDSAPDANARIAPKHQDHFSHRLAKRVRRSAVPTEFDRRIDKRTRGRIRAILRPLAGHIDSILIAIDPDDQELPGDQDYAMQLVGLMESADYDDPARRTAVDQAMRDLAEVLDDCPGIELDTCVSQSMGQMTIDVYRDFIIWDYDELSLNAEADPPAQIR